MVLESVAFDIETTGFEVDDEVTVVGFAVSLGCRVFVQDPRTGESDEVMSVDAGTVEARVDEPVSVSVYASEEALLEAVGQFVADRFVDDDVLLVAFNGEQWRGGFDLPFLRTRLVMTGVSWPFRDVPYADVLPVVRRRFNTTVEGEEQNDLVGAYGTLIGDGLNTVDPFMDSAEAVEAFADGRMTDLVTHNVADVVRTRALTRLAERYCSKSEFNVKSLTATRQHR